MGQEDTKIPAEDSSGRKRHSHLSFKFQSYRGSCLRSATKRPLDLSMPDEAPALSRKMVVVIVPAHRQLSVRKS
jgi:hypothetical protein